MFLVKPCKEKSLEEVWEVEREIFGDEAWSYSLLLSEFRNRFSLFLVGLPLKRELIAGYLIGRLVRDEAELLRIGVRKEFQKKGLGKALVREFFSICEKKGIRSIFLEVRETNNRAISFYESLGFQKVAKRSFYYRKEDAILMKKEILN